MNGPDTMQRPREGTPSEHFLASLYHWDGQSLSLASDDAFAGPASNLPGIIRLSGDGTSLWGVSAARYVTGFPFPTSQLSRIEVEP